jgi:two-component system, NtrC family, nitrogen regulation sensor histidine kinase NtrY
MEVGGEVRFRRRLALVFVFVAMVPLIVVGTVVLRVVQRFYDGQAAATLDKGSAVARDLLDDVRAEVDRRVRLLAESPELEDLSANLGTISGRDLAEKGEQMMKVSDLNLLSVVDAAGQVITCGHLPQSLGTRDRAALHVIQSGTGVIPVIETVRDGDEIRRALGFVAARAVEYGTQKIYVVAGIRLDTAFAQRLARTSGAVASLADGEGEFARSGDAPGSGRSREMLLADGDQKVASLTLSVSDSPLKAARLELIRRIVSLLVVMTVFAATLAFVFSPIVTRPVEALAQGAQAIAGGELGRQVEVRASGELRALVTAFNEMSRNLKSATERAAVAERIATWRDVGRRLAHEIKNPLTPIQISMETAVNAREAGRTDFDEIFRESAHAVLEEVGRLRKIVDEFSKFARLPSPQPALLDLSEVAQSVLALYASPPHGITLSRELPSGLQVMADRDQIAQVLINLIRNAEEAIAGVGRADGQIVVRARAVSPGEVSLEVEDNGPGVAVSERGRIFEPYFTTKEGGTGLGLAIAQRIADEHGGRMEVAGEPGHGAVFRLVLPRHGERSSAAA